MITLAYIYILVGVFFAIISVLSLIDKANPRRALNFLFWGLLAVSFLAGAYLGDLGNGVLALGLVVVAGELHLALAPRQRPAARGRRGLRDQGRRQLRGRVCRGGGTA